jgi:hypothetical protein
VGKKAQKQNDVMNNFNIYTYTFQNIYTTLCKCKKFGHVKCKSFTLTHDLHDVYMTIDAYTHNTSLNLFFLFILSELIVNDV